MGTAVCLNNEEISFPNFLRHSEKILSENGADDLLVIALLIKELCKFRELLRLDK